MTKLILIFVCFAPYSVFNILVCNFPPFCCVISLPVLLYKKIKHTFARDMAQNIENYAEIGNLLRKGEHYEQ